MSRYDPFDVVVVPFPYADRLAEKRRPALVISNRKLAAHGLIWVAMITSADNEPWPRRRGHRRPQARGIARALGGAAGQDRMHRTWAD